MVNLYNIFKLFYREEHKICGVILDFEATANLLLQ